MWEIKIEELDNRKFDSYIGRNRTWWAHYNQYRNAAFALANAVNNGIPIDIISLPIFFQIRHCIELGLKANILEFEKINTNVKKLNLAGNSHHLEFLLNRFYEHLDHLKLEKLPDSVRQEMSVYQSKLKLLIEKIHFLDKSSYSFRYPVNINGEPSFEWGERQDLFQFVELLKHVDDFIMFTLPVLQDNGVIIEY